MTPQEAVELLTDDSNSVYIDPDEDVVSMRATKPQYAALLALLEGLRPRRVSEEKPPDSDYVLAHIPGGPLGGWFVTIGRGLRADGYWMPLPPHPETA